MFRGRAEPWRGAPGRGETHLSKRSAFLAEVDHNPDAAALSALDGLLDAEDEVRAARADVGSEDVRAIALVVYAEGELLGRVADV